jgi:hypothetical protein
VQGHCLLEGQMCVAGLPWLVCISRLCLAGNQVPPVQQLLVHWQPDVFAVSPTDCCLAACDLDMMLLCHSFGPKSFIIISDPAYAKQILYTNADKYSKGLLR